MRVSLCDPPVYASPFGRLDHAATRTSTGRSPFTPRPFQVQVLSSIYGIKRRWLSPPSLIPWLRGKDLPGCSASAGLRLRFRSALTRSLLEAPLEPLPSRSRLCRFKSYLLSATTHNKSRPLDGFMCVVAGEGLEPSASGL